jgi:hypothetical protein
LLGFIKINALNPYISLKSFAKRGMRLSSKQKKESKKRKKEKERKRKRYDKKEEKKEENKDSPCSHKFFSNVPIKKRDCFKEHSRIRIAIIYPPNIPYTCTS